MSSEGDNAPTTSSGAAAAMLNQPIVMDCGTAIIKAGFAGGTKPKVCTVNKNELLNCFNTYIHMMWILMCSQLFRLTNLSFIHFAAHLNIYNNIR